MSLDMNHYRKKGVVNYPLNSYQELSYRIHSVLQVIFHKIAQYKSPNHDNYNKVFFIVEIICYPVEN